MFNSGVKITVTLFLSFCLPCFTYGQDSISSQKNPTQKSLNLVLTKKSNSKKHIIKIGDRLEIKKQNAKEIKGNVTNIQNQTIYVEKVSIGLDDIYSLKKKQPIRRQVTGGIIAGVGTLFLLSGTVLGGMYEDGGVSNIAIGAGLVAVSIPFLIEKNYNKKRWNFKIE